MFKFSSWVFSIFFTVSLQNKLCRNKKWKATETSDLVSLILATVLQGRSNRYFEEASKVIYNKNVSALKFRDSVSGCWLRSPIWTNFESFSDYTFSFSWYFFVSQCIVPLIVYPKKSFYFKPTFFCFSVFFSIAYSDRCSYVSVLHFATSLLPGWHWRPCHSDFHFIKISLKINLELTFSLRGQVWESRGLKGDSRVILCSWLTFDCSHLSWQGKKLLFSVAGDWRINYVLENVVTLGVIKRS